MNSENENQLTTAPSTEMTSPETLNMIKSFRYVDDETRAMLIKQPSLIARVFPSVKQRMINEIQSQVLQLNGEMYIDAVKALGQFQNQALKEELNDRLMRGAAIIRTETIKVAQDKLVEVTQDLTRNQQKAIKGLEDAFHFCEGIKVDFLRKKYESTIISLTEDVFDTFDRLSKHFKNFLDLKIGSIQQPGK